MKAFTTSGRLRTLALATLLGLGTVAGVSGCDEGPAENAGEEIDEAADEAGDAVDEAEDEISEEN